MTIDVGGYQEALQEESRESVKRQAEIESADDVSFDEYRERYFA
jgi:hypothetical protein